MRSFFIAALLGTAPLLANEPEPVLDLRGQVGGSTAGAENATGQDAVAENESATGIGSPSLDLKLELDAQPGKSASNRRTRDAAPEVLLKEGLRRVTWLEKSGAQGLAAAVLTDQRPDVSDTVEWMKWERRLWQNLVRRKHWTELEARQHEVMSLAKSGEVVFPKEFLDEAGTIAVDALMQQRKFAAARDSIRRLLIADTLSAKARLTLRRKIFLSYLWDDNLGDTNIAMDRFQREYFPDDNRWNLLRARVLLRSNEPSKAVSQIASVTSHEARLIRLIGRLRNGSLTPNEIIDKAKAIDPSRLKSEQRIERWALIAEAAKRAGVLRIQVDALEQALSLSREVNDKPIIDPAEHDLLTAYLALAERAGNGAHLLVGDFDGWLGHADSLIKKTPIDARAIYVYLAQSVGLPNLVKGAWSKFAASLRRQDLTALIYRLFGPGRPLGEFSVLGATIALELSEEAMKNGNIKLAADLSAGVVQPPKGSSWLGWRLRQARMNIYAGNADDGLQILESIFDAITDASEKEIDRILQLVFDLQTLGLHQDSVNTLERLLGFSKNRNQQREILFWIADSLNAIGESERAALFFLRSASMQGGEDLWIQTARYRAAGALEKAGLIDDARALYKNLLAVTRDPKRREQLTRKLQDLWLIEARAKAEKT